ncbi:RES family NAD+ phosphorylase [Psychrobacter aestuarii]|uniref:RES domain-containing protein n=1 Tax=Psychrobacter aestuarii TaxID=556327 RepID=A0ABN0VWP8_9GAMM|nr:RES family NAD+ phosphorylase [Psychrobacter aestuarii]
MNYVCSECVNIESIKNENLFTLYEKRCCYCKEIKNSVADKGEIISLLSLRFKDSIIPFSECSEHEQGMFFYAHDDKLDPKEFFELLDFVEFGSEDFKGDLSDKVQDILGEQSEELFVYNDGNLDHNNDYEDRWSDFIKSIHYNHRFFNKNVKEFLDSLFSLIHENRVVREDVIYELNPNISIFRARIANTVKERTDIYSDPANQLGPVPAILAGEQRMTPTGISAFYASENRETCFSEVRATTGDVVMSAEFRAKKILRLLDLSKLKEISKMAICPFDKDFVDKSHKSCFIARLVFLLSKPASQRKNSVYLETQVIFEYFRTYFSENIHGIAFKSIQSGMKGMNFALFPEYSKVSAFLYNDNNTVSCEESINKEYRFYFYNVKTKNLEDVLVKKEEALEFVDRSIVLHHVIAVTTKTQEFEIERSIDE